MLAAGILVIGFSGLAIHLRTDPASPFSPNQYSGSAECINDVKKLEGATLQGVHTLHCSLEPRTIGNSHLTAQYLSYYGEPGSNPERCADIDKSFLGNAGDYYKYCVGNQGVITSDGKFYPGVGNNDPSTVSGYDYCYSTEYTQFVHDNGDILRDDFKPGAAPSIHDLYFYQGQLYDRDVYQHASFQTQFGTCTLNGTTLTDYTGKVCGPNKNDGCYTGGVITNVTVGYSGFPTTCQTAAIGHTQQEADYCISLVTAANASLHDCDANWGFVLGPPNPKAHPTNTEDYQIVLGFKPSYSYANDRCTNAYLMRMAVLDRCQEISDAGERSTCETDKTAPSGDVRRVTTPL